MIEDPSIGLKIAETPREAMIKELTDNAEKRILQRELSLELEKNALQVLKTLK
jgi:hypothetical protein